MTEHQKQQYRMATGRLPRLTDLIIKYTTEYKGRCESGMYSEAEKHREDIHSVYDSFLDTIMEVAYLENIKGNGMPAPVMP